MWNFKNKIGKDHASGDIRFNKIIYFLEKIDNQIDGQKNKQAQAEKFTIFLKKIFLDNFHFFLKIKGGHFKN
jgi:hypothetical protein